MKTAVIVVDMQNAFCHPEGSFRKRGYSIIDIDSVIETNRRLADFANSQRWPIFYTMLEFEEDYSDAGLLVAKHPDIKQMRAYMKNSFDSRIIAALKAEQTGTIIKKKRYDPFIRSELEDSLREGQYRRIVISGVLTDVCVESTVRSAFDRGFEPIVVRDGTSTDSRELYEASLETLGEHFAYVYRFDEIQSLFNTVQQC